MSVTGFHLWASQGHGLGSRGWASPSSLLHEGAVSSRDQPTALLHGTRVSPFSAGVLLATGSCLTQTPDLGTPHRSPQGGHGPRPSGSPAPGEDTCLPHSPGPACCSQPASSLSPPPAASAGSSGTGPSEPRAGSRGHRRPASAGLGALPQRSCLAPEGARGRGAPQAPPAALRSARSPLWQGRTGVHVGKGRTAPTPTHPCPQLENHP